MFKKVDKNTIRKAKHDRLRNTLVGTSERPRLNVYRSTTNIYAQIIDSCFECFLSNSFANNKSLFFFVLAFKFAC